MTLIQFIKKHIGIKILLAFSSVLGIALALVIFISGLIFQDFGSFAISENEQQLKKQAANFLDAITQERAQKYDAVFQKIAAYSYLIAKQAEIKFQSPGHPQSVGPGAENMQRYPQNGIYYNRLSSPLATIYWGGEQVPEAVLEEIGRLAPFLSVLRDAKEQNPAVVASHLIMTSGWAHYYPNSDFLYTLPPLTELDLRDTNNYVLALPERNPKRSTIWVPVYFDDVGNGLMTTASTPIFGSEGRFMGVAGLDLPIQNIQRQILTATDVDVDLKSKGFFTFLLDDRGQLISFPVDKLIQFGIDVPTERFENSFDLLERGLADSRIASVRDVGERILTTEKQTSVFLLGEDPYLVSSQRLVSNGWYLVTTLPEQIFLAPSLKLGELLAGKLSSLQYQFYLMAIFFIVGSIIIIVVFLNTTFLRPLKILTTAVRSVRDGDLDQDLKSRRVDEIGMLMNSFEDMLSTLKESKEREHDHAEHLEKTVREQTYELQLQKAELEKDILRRKSVEKELIQSKHQADAANLAKSQFLSNITHELRTPLIGVLGMNELLLRTDLDAQQHVLVDSVQSSGHDLLSMVNSILDFSKLESGAFELESHVFDLAAAVEDVVLLLSGTAAEKSLELVVQIADDALWTVRGDEARLRQILLNLVSNAVKFTVAGQVIVDVALEAADQQTGTLILQVRDSGIGMSEESLNKIFEAFVQVDNSETREYGGTGLGLAIVQKLVMMMNGTIHVSSRQGEGSAFTVTLPLQLVAPQNRHDHSFAGRGRILLQVEQSLVREALENMLRSVEADLSVVSDGEKFWSRLNPSERHLECAYDILIVEAKARLENGELLYERILNSYEPGSCVIICLCDRAGLLEKKLPDTILPLEKPVTRTQLFSLLEMSRKNLSEKMKSPAI